MSINGLPSIFDRGYADALRVDYYTTCQENMFTIQPGVYVP